MYIYKPYLVTDLPLRRGRNKTNEGKAKRQEV